MPFGTSAPGQVKVLYDSLLTAPAASFDITGLDLDADGGEYYLSLQLVRAGVGTNNATYIYLNNDTTASHYYRQELNVSHTSISGARANNPEIAYLTGAYPSSITLKVSRVSGKEARWQAFSDYNGTSGIIMRTLFGVWTTVGNVTRITIVDAGGNSFSAGSRVRLWRIKR